MTERHRKAAPQTAREGMETGVQEQVAKTDRKHRDKPPRKTRGLGEVQRKPQRAMREAERATSKDDS
jgi:hypothetical protein